METTLHTDWTIADICNGFVYNEFEAKGLFGMGGLLTIQPEYQRNYIYVDGKKDVAVIDSVLKGYPFGVIYFVKTFEGRYKVLDGQQRITSLGRFFNGKLSIKDENGLPKSIGFIAGEKREKFLANKLLIYECEGTFSNSQNSKMQMWCAYISGAPNRQDIIATALEWVSKGNIHRKLSNAL